MGWTSLLAQTLKNLPAMWETWVWSLGLDNPLEKEWLPTPVFLSGEFHGLRSLAGYSPWGHRELNTTEGLTLSHSSFPGGASGKEPTCQWRRCKRHGWNLLAMWETWVWSLGWEDPLEKGTAIHSSILAWRIPWTMQSQRVRYDWMTFTFTFTFN